jgi:hypothetical protein
MGKNQWEKGKRRKGEKSNACKVRTAHHKLIGSHDER